MLMTRRKFLEIAASIGASLAFPSGCARASEILWKERRDLYPQGVASGDPDSNSVILWTRRPPIAGNEAQLLTLEVANDPAFQNVVTTAQTKLSAETDWTCRVLAAELKPRQEYWYRFTDEQGFGSRIGRTITAPDDTDEKPVSFAFVSCQNVQQGASNAYRRMIFEDERKKPEERLGFVLHLGDFVYEIVWYPEDRPQGMYDRRLRDIVRYPNGEKYSDFHYAMTVEDYRALYQGYLTDPDLQDARARWPFVCVWDNHEYSWKGWQSLQDVSGARPAQKTKVAANQAWFEYQPARVIKPGGSDLNRFDPPAVTNSKIEKFDEHGLGQEPGNIAAINSLKIYRKLRYGRNVDLILTDNHSYRSEPVMQIQGIGSFQPKGIPYFFPQDVLEILDGGNAYNQGHPPETIRFEGADVPNPRKNSPPQTVLGITQKEWFRQQLSVSTAKWKLWGNSIAMLDCRTNLQNLPPDLPVRWPTGGYAIIADDWSSCCVERSEILSFIKQQNITGLVSIAGDRHSFFAGLLSSSLSPKRYEPVGVEFITASISAPGIVEALTYNVPKEYREHPMFTHDRSNIDALQTTMNSTILHGVDCGMELFRTGDSKQALAKRNAKVSPHLSFIDLGGHGYSTVRATSQDLYVEFVCIPRPLERSEAADGGPILYRLAHRLKLWKDGEKPQLERIEIEGTLPVLL